MSYSGKMNEKDQAELERRIVDLYVQGVPMKQITTTYNVGRERVKEITTRHNVYIPNRSRLINCKNSAEKIAAYYKEQDVTTPIPVQPIKALAICKTAITRGDIERIRKSVKVGDKLNIKTEKALDTFDHKEVGNVPTVRTATVISTKNPSFCLVKIDKTGLTETVSWVDMEMARRNEKKYV